MDSLAPDVSPAVDMFFHSLENLGAVETYIFFVIQRMIARDPSRLAFTCGTRRR
jgi:hypothetical protein